MPRLLVNIDHVATLRNARRERFPDPVHAAALCEAAGADGIVFHLREDRRHITDRDVALLKETVRGRLDFELSTAEEVVAVCCATEPDLATLVPERREEVTTEGGLDAVAHEDRLRGVIDRLHEAGAEVSLFLDPVPRQIDAAAALGADAVELHTGDFARAYEARERARVRGEVGRLTAAAQQAHEAGLMVHAGHGLDYHNWRTFAAVPHVEEVSIGFAIVARAVLVGMEQAVREMRTLLHESPA
jgi:pyridoxine 5-phosphate synthase